MKLSISTIKVENNRRSVENTKLQELAESMEKVGLLHPVTVTSDYTLVAGAQRLVAAKLLGWDEIEVKIFDFDTQTAELAMLDENLMRVELHYIERGEWLAKRKKIYEQLHPETKNGGDTRTNTIRSAPAFVDDTANKIGVSRRVLEQEIQIANNLTPVTKEVVITADIPKKDALKLARMEHEEQEVVISKIINGDAKNVAEAIESPKPPVSPEPPITITPVIPKPHIAHNSGNNEWYTPKEYIEAARIVLGCIDLDPASCEIANKVVQAEKYYTAENNGLSQHWQGNIWLNPPYAGELISLFCDKLKTHVANRDVKQAIVLVNNATETAWFHTLIGTASSVLFPKSRVKFYMPDGKTGAPLQGQAVVYIGENPAFFMETFKPFGWGAFL